jgi:hypothetical protein
MRQCAFSAMRSCLREWWRPIELAADAALRRGAKVPGFRARWLAGAPLARPLLPVCRSAALLTFRREEQDIRRRPPADPVSGEKSGCGGHALFTLAAGPVALAGERPDFRIL